MIRGMKALKKSKWDPAKVRAAMFDRGLRQVDLCYALGFSKTGMSRWLSKTDKSTPTDAQAAAIWAFIQSS